MVMLMKNCGNSCLSFTPAVYYNGKCLTIDPVPSIMVETVASTLALPSITGCVPRPETAVVIREYGPLTIIPTRSSRATSSAYVAY